MNVFIAIDDTDNEESIGTGRLARLLADELARRGLVSHTHVTRHQLLVHPQIPYTSHNSCACIGALQMGPTTEAILVAARDFLISNFHEGSNPGLCVVPHDAVPEGLRAFGYRAQKEVIEIAEARRLANQLCLSGWWSGETGQGCIGAMAGAGLRSTGNDGRFIGLDGIRDLKGVLSVGEVIRQTAIHRVASVSGETLGDHEAIDTLGWVRPSLRDGKATLYVVRDGTRWRPAEKRKGKG